MPVRIGDTEEIQDDFGNVEEYLKNILCPKTYARYFYYIPSQSTEISQIFIGIIFAQVKKYFGQPKIGRDTHIITYTSYREIGLVLASCYFLKGNLVMAV